MKKNKYCYLWVIQGFYGGHWEDMTEYDKSETSYSEVRHDLKEYRNDGYGAPYRLISRRELNEEQSMAMNKNDAIQGFVNANERFTDYWSMQLAWTCHIDWLFSEHMITERQRQNWGNPCSPETFKRWSNKWYGLKEYDYERLAPTCESIRVGCCKDYYQE